MTTDQKSSADQKLTVVRLNTAAIPQGATPVRRAAPRGRPQEAAPVPPPPPDFDYTPLLAILRDEHAAVEFLLYKVKVQNLILAAGEHRWLGASTSEVSTAVQGLNAATARREQLATEANTAHGLAHDASLSTLAGRIPDELVCQQLLQRQVALRNALDLLRRCSRHNREMLAHGLAATTDALTMMGRVPTYDATGTVARTVPQMSFDARV